MKRWALLRHQFRKQKQICSTKNYEVTAYNSLIIESILQESKVAGDVNPANFLGKGKNLKLLELLETENEAELPCI
jgi:hypothetical protein